MAASRSGTCFDVRRLPMWVLMPALVECQVMGQAIIRFAALRLDSTGQGITLLEPSLYLSPIGIVATELFGAL